MGERSSPCDEACSACCGRAVGALGCNFCDKTYTHCLSHRETAKTAIRGHVFRVHPEKMRQQVVQIMNDAQLLAGFESQRAAHPALWERFFSYMDEVRRGRS